MNIALDHVTLGAATLEAGAAHLRQELGIEMAPGGAHPHMSTHNRVLNVGETRFLELLAVDPDAAAPPRRRWFGMDDPAMIARLAERPRAVGWVLRTDDIQRLRDASAVDLGAVTPMSRGSRSWKLTVRDDGMMPFSGLVPAFIEWSEGPHPADAMPFLGPVLSAVELRHPQADRLRDVLEALGAASFATVRQDDAGPSMAFVFRLADGSLRTLGR